ncbi:MAG: PGF-pre-PGF domain-containing protein [DPANN group archaeon]|nr:PGF-pre-PGF domain-containing protein [DPANN group archaeon]
MDITDPTPCSQVGGCTWNGSACNATPSITGTCFNITASTNCAYNTSNVCEWDILPSVNLMIPSNDSINTTGNVTFYCNATDDYDLDNLSLAVWNSSGANYYFSTTPFSGMDDMANQSSWPLTNMPSDIYSWNCLASDDVDQTAWAAANYTLNVSTGGASTSMSVTKTLLSSSTPSIGETVRFQITITNTGGSTISEVWMHDDYENLDLSFDNVSSSCPIKSNENDGPNVNSIVINVTPCITGTFDSGNTTVVRLNFTALSAGVTTNTVEISFTEHGTNEDNDSASVNIQAGGGSNESASAINVTLISPSNGLMLSSNSFTLNFTVNTTSECMAYWDFNPEGIPPDYADVPTGWGPVVPDLTYIATGMSDHFFSAFAPNRNFTWNVRCNTTDYSWAAANWTFTVNGSMPECLELDMSTCDSTANCTWEDYDAMCLVDCMRFDYIDNETCESAFGGGICEWESFSNLCDPIGEFFEEGFEGFSFCFEYDGNKTGCDSFSEDCAWFSEPNCQSWDDCYDATEPGWCDPTNFNWGGDFSCWDYDGNQTGCNDASVTLAWPCEWHDDDWCNDPTWDCWDAINGTHGWCDMSFGGGVEGGCWDSFDQANCEAITGLPCTWQTGGGAGSGWCEDKGCWDYWDESSCTSAPAEEGCAWNSQYYYCYEEGCWDFINETNCITAGLNCSWTNDSYNPNGGWCDKDGCWDYDWTNVSDCENAFGGGKCRWNSPWCEEKGCWDFQSNSTCTDSSLNCEWMSDTWGWCEQQGCWYYDGTNESACVNATGLSCTWDAGSNLCFENFLECYEIDSMNDCFDTGWCFWDFAGNGGNGSCESPVFQPTDFFNPGCWGFSQAGEGACTNITTCAWNSSEGTCDDNGTANTGVQCGNISNSVMCNSIPMLSSCCSWNGSVCLDAPFTTSCWDNMQEPPEGGHFCDDYIATSNEAICNQIAGDPWYMPCEWNNQTAKCNFQFDDMFGGDAHGFGFDDVGSQSNCEAMGGVWIQEQWTDASGNVHWDNWCEMNFGFGSEICSDSCWACEFQDNGSAWSNNASARSACEESAAGCVFYQDSYAFNGFGWCDMNWGQQGNCDQNCWDCWEEDQCADSVTGCKWFTDQWNANMGWCDDKNIKTCDDECYNCWDQNNCGASDAGCTWDSDYWFCKPQGTGEGGESSEICFDGIDNDADTFVDCGDPECMFDSFCGGSDVFGSNCPSIPNNVTCLSEGCVWITDNWNNSWCDMNGSQCWLFDDNETACNLEGGCNYMNMSGFGSTTDSFCDINFTFVDSAQCWNYGQNASTCDSAPEDCVWVYDEWCQNNPSDSWCWDGNNTGWCDHVLWSCHNYDNNQTACNEQSQCGWITDWFNPAWGWCDPVCFSRNGTTCDNDVNISGTMTAGICLNISADNMGWCEPENMFKGCWDYGGDSGSCDGDDACTWIDDPFTGGFCGDKFMVDMVGDMDQSPPLVLETESCINGSNEYVDICGLGIKDMAENFGVGTAVYSMANTAICNDRFPEFNGTNMTTKYYWYFDTDGNQSGGCNATDNSSLVGFDLKFKYEALKQGDELVETKVSYKCLSGQWSPSKIKVSAWADKMCYMVIGGVISISKEDLTKLSVLGIYDETADMRIYATTANDSGSDSSVFDAIGPVWYSHGAADFRFEDCEGFVDMDGDGLEPSDDPDCVDFLKYGFIDIEKGWQCDDNIDNDGNNLVDCNDPGCMYDTFYCTASDYANDVSAPTITWLEVEEFSNGAFIGVDTDEPTNGTLLFYHTDPYCANISALNSSTILDWKLENAFDLDDFDLWHDFPVDQFIFDEKNISTNFITNTTYHYKLRLCDKSDNCALSACLNFTTSTEVSEYVVGFDLPPPADDVTEHLGNVFVHFDWEGTGDFNDTIDSGSGFMINDTQGRDVDLRFNNPNSTDKWGIDFIGVDFVKAQSLNITDAFIVNETAGGQTMVGMDSDKWSEIAQKLGVDQVKIEIPDGGNSENSSLMHCPDNATSLSDPACVEISLSDVNCTFNTTTTICWIPSSIGFSLFGIVTSGGDEDTTTDDDGPGGGGPSGTPTASVVSYTKTWTTITSGETKTVTINEDTYGGVPFTSLEFDALNDLTSAQVQVRALTSAPSSTGTITHKAYKYLQLVETNIGDDDVANTKIGFRVPVEWLTNNSVSRENVALFRYTSDAWDEQETTFLYENNTNAYYEATTTGFSYFAIGQRTEEVAPPPEEEEEEEKEEVIPTGEVVGEPEPEAEEEEEEEAGPGFSRASVIWSIIVIVVVIIVMYLFMKEGKLQKMLHPSKLKEHGVDRPGDLGKLDSFVSKHLEAGHSKEEIKKSLLDADWSEDKVDASLEKYAK